jgi:hypothetical protein
MKKILRLKQRGRIAASFALLFVFFVILGLFSTSGIERITRSFRSMYEDRLIPSMDISEMLALLYENRVSVENHITTRDSIELIQYEQAVYRNHKKLDSLINKLSLTYLVPQEKQDLQQFTAALLIFGRMPRWCFSCTSATSPGTACSAHTPQTESALALTPTRTLFFGVSAAPACAFEVGSQGS